jgi:hypothetical protein
VSSSTRFSVFWTSLVTLTCSGRDVTVGFLCN